jgi:hypothetical protein
VFISVRWGNSNSNYYKMSQGIRQGGILSPALFAVCVDDTLVKLENSRRGCFINGSCLNSIMYADDLVYYQYLSRI